MIQNYFKIAWRNLIKNKAHSAINIVGLSVGMAVAMIIGLWIWDELSYDKDNPNYEKIAQVMQNNTINGEIGTWTSMPMPMGEELRKSYGSDFKYVLMSSWTETHFLSVGDKKITKDGNFFEPQAPDMLNLKMLKGTRDGLKETFSMLISSSMAKALFGDADPMGKIIRMDDKLNATVTGVYADLPRNSRFASMSFISPWNLKLYKDTWMTKMNNPWGNNSFQLFVQIADHANMETVSKKIKDAKLRNVDKEDKRYNPQLFLHPMKNWHLRGEFKNGKNVGGAIQYVWLFGIIGSFVLMLACINFMNLSTARSQKRAREVGIRKAVGSLRQQLVGQFYMESILVAFIAFILALLLVQLMLPLFNGVADKEMKILWTNPLFWIYCLAFTAITGLIAGSYPALYLSSFQPVKVLKGTFQAGRFAAIPRKVLVVLQFTVSVVLIIGTVVVFRQVQFAKNRPIGYDRNGLIMAPLLTPEIHNHFEAIRNDLINAGAITEMTESGGPTTAVWSTNGGFMWKGKDPNLGVDFPNNGVTYGYGKTVGWQFVDGRDFSKSFSTDTAAFIMNEAAAKYIGLKNIVGETITWDDHPFKIIGVIKNMIIEDPYQQIRPQLFHIDPNPDSYVIIRINPKSVASASMEKIKKTFASYSPAEPFNFQWVDQEYAKKFGDEERIGKLAGFFAGLAIFISCLGLFGMASFMAEQRIKEIGVRKVLGASVVNLWGLLSKDFVGLVVISLIFAIPLSIYLMGNWLGKYSYRSDLSWWIFGTACAGALLITLLTVSYQAIKAAMANPVKSLKTE
ncbi:MAG TPA: ABC transporter permease [Puia sp.]|jgi:ABC-type antimicrobial peptide transport system permease subunit